MRARHLVGSVELQVLGSVTVIRFINSSYESEDIYRAYIYICLHKESQHHIKSPAR